jgi:hypothetical protein
MYAYNFRGDWAAVACGLAHQVCAVAAHILAYQQTCSACAGLPATAINHTLPASTSLLGFLSWYRQCFDKVPSFE